MDHEANLAVNEVTVLLVIAGIPTTALMAAFVVVSVWTILKGNLGGSEKLR